MEAEDEENDEDGFDDEDDRDRNEHEEENEVDNEEGNTAIGRSSDPGRRIVRTALRILRRVPRTAIRQTVRRMGRVRG